jgi:HAMP domain-containing protein
MRWNSIQTKVLAALIACLVVGVGGILALMRYSFERNSQVLAAESVTSAQRLFTILETREIGKMTVVSDTLLTDTQVRDAFVRRDRQRLQELAEPLYEQYQEEGITNWLFHSAPDMTVFLRVHNPAKFGDHLNRFLDREVVQANSLVAGKELAKAGFALRIIRPFYDAQGGVTGYVELGEELGQFMHTMKEQTGSDFGLLLDKQYLDRQMWADSSAAWHRRDNWNDNPEFVVADETSDSGNLFHFHGELSNLPSEGLVLERFQQGDSVLVRGIFPIYDAAGHTVGAMFVMHDISSFYLAMRHTCNVLVLVTIAALAGGIVLVLTLLNRLVFRRLQYILSLATRVVGGDYQSQIPVHSNDEVGELEQLFEQFRRVFVDLLASVPGLQQRA